MKKVFYSKRDWWLGLILFLPFLGALGGTIAKEHYKQALLPAVILVLLIWLWFGTKYIITQNKLKVWAGFLPFPSVPIEKIIKIKPTKSFISAPACSLDRILVQYSSSDYIIISPKDRSEFVKYLKEQNSEILISNEVEN